MLTSEQNELLTRVGAGTPMGELMRRYWHPVATSQDLKSNPVRSVRILGETLTLYRDRRDRLGLIAQRCAHRRVDLKCGIPEEEGLRCPYHGWLYDATGQCLSQPSEDPNNNTAHEVKIASYPVEEMGGLIWAYLGPQPVPLLPRWDLFVIDNGFRQIGTTMVPCNWLQCQENSVDTIHTEWAHGRLGLYALERSGNADPHAIAHSQRFSRKHVKFDFKRIPIGIQKFRLREGEGAGEEAEEWRIGHPLIFPNVVRIGQPGYSEFQIRVPVDDTHTWHLAYQVFFPGGGVRVPEQNPVPAFEVPMKEIPDFVLSQDLMCWINQGEITDRSKEWLGASDRGLVLFRRMLMEQIKIVEDGGEPMNVFRDPVKNQFLDLDPDNLNRPALTKYRKGSIYYHSLGKSSPYLEELEKLLLQGAEMSKRKAAAEETAPRG